MSAIHQIFVIAKTEFRFGLRRGWPVVSTVAVLLVIFGSILVFTALNLQDLPRQYAVETSGNSLVMVWPGFSALALGILTMACAPAIPVDRQFGVMEWICSMPLTGFRYLLGKVIGTVAVVLCVSLCMLVVFTGIHYVFLGPIHIPLYLAAVLFSGLPVLIWAPALGVIVGTWVNKRLASVFAGLFAGLFGQLPWGWFSPPPEKTIAVMGSASAWINRYGSHLPIADWVWASYGWQDPWWPPVSDGTVVLTITVAYLILALAGVLACVWLIAKENF